MNLRSANKTSAALLAFIATVISNPTLAAASGAETLPSGVIITHLKPGSGKLPTASDTVRVHYRGTLTNGTEFDSSYKRGQPASFALNQVIPCWTQGVQKMRSSGKAKLFCPANTAYGARGVPGLIPPQSVLMFEIELLAIE